MCAKMIVTIVTIVTLSGADGPPAIPRELELCSVGSRAMLRIG
jgi:hypothetical protein